MQEYNIYPLPSRKHTHPNILYLAHLLTLAEVHHKMDTIYCPHAIKSCVVRTVGHSFTLRMDNQDGGGGRGQ